MARIGSYRGLACVSLLCPRREQDDDELREEGRLEARSRALKTPAWSRQTANTCRQQYSSVYSTSWQRNKNDNSSPTPTQHSLIIVCSLPPSPASRKRARHNHWGQEAPARLASLGRPLSSPQLPGPQTCCPTQLHHHHHRPNTSAPYYHFTSPLVVHLSSRPIATSTTTNTTLPHHHHH